MDSNNNLLITNSILYRCTQKFYDKQFAEFEIGAGQILFLILIYENEGISMYTLAQKGFFDKGTVSKGIQKLEEFGYIRMETDVNDKRMKCLYTTEKAKEIMAKVYLIRREWWDSLTNGLTPEEAEQFEVLQNKLMANALKYADIDESKIKFFGLQKLSLLDYPGKMACTMFTGGCNFRCPFCQNSDLVFLPENTIEIPTENIMSFLQKRVNILEGVCISGGEPLLQDELEYYLVKIKELGYKIKLDTNGSFPEKLKKLVEKNLIDFVAMDIKNCPSKYGETIGVSNFDLTPIQKSIDYLKEGHVEYEFRTTIVKEFHNEEDIIAIGKWLKGANAYYLQNFEDGECVIQQGLTSWDKETLQKYQQLLKPFISNTQLRGI